MATSYPEFSQFKELPAWGFYIRHAEGITFDNVTFKALKKDYRPAIVMDDAGEVTFKDVRLIDPEGE